VTKAKTVKVDQAHGDGFESYYGSKFAALEKANYQPVKVPYGEHGWIGIEVPVKHAVAAAAFLLGWEACAAAKRGW
jgi:hypothetical protein